MMATKIHEVFDQLRQVALDADQKKLSVFIDQFKIEYPDIYSLIDIAADMPAQDAFNLLCARWPALILFKLHPDNQQIIQAVQNEIKLRKANND